MTPEETIETRIRENKQELISKLKEVPIIEIACKKAGVSRATYYRFRKDDEEFGKAADEAIAEGEALINDMSEVQVISLIKERNWPAISFWLRHNSPKYAQRIEVSANINQPKEELNPEQEAVVREALRLSSLLVSEGKSSEDGRLTENVNQAYEQSSNKPAEPASASS